MSIVENKEVVRIVVKKFNGKMQPECKKLCVDPQLTSFDVLQHLLVKAFDIKTDFAIYYLATDNYGQNVYLSLLSDWDLDAAFFGASNPHLSLKVDLKPFEDDGLDEDWDVVASYEVGRNSTEGLTLSTSLKSFINQKVSRVIQAIGLRPDENTNYRPQKPPMSDAEFHNFLDAVGHLVQPQQFRLSVYQGGVEPSLRRVVWRHLLNIYPDKMTGRERFDYLTRKSIEYYRLRDDWLARDTENVQYISNMVRKDVLRTDRTHAFFAGTDESDNVVALFNLLVTFALTHPKAGYCQGMSDLASPLLVIEKDEAHAYICFCSLMQRLESNFCEDGMLMTTKFEHLSLLLQHHDPVFADYLRQENSDMFFCYRWILLEMKREFPLDDALFMLEVMWSTMPFDPPETEISLADAAYFEGGVSGRSPSVGNFIQMRARQRRLSSAQSTPLPSDHMANLGVGLTHSAPSSCDVQKLESGGSRNRTDCKGAPEGDGKTTELSQRSKNHAQVSTDQLRQPSDVNASAETSEDLNDGPCAETDVTRDDDTPRSSDKPRKGAKKKPTDVAAPGETGVASLHDVDLSSGDEDADEQTNLLDPAFVNVSELERLVQLPPPTEFGRGNPFLMFLCLSLLLQHRDHVMTNRMDYNEIAVFFDRMVRKHDVHSVVHHAKIRYALYLRQQQQQVAAVDGSDSDLTV